MKTVILIILLIFENCNFCKSKIEGLKLEKINSKCYVYLKEYDVYIEEEKFLKFGEKIYDTYWIY